MRINHHIALIILHICVFNSLLKSQDGMFQNFTLEDGLPSDIIYDIEIDKDGFLWIATDNGISKYDGYGFQNYKKQDGIASNEIINIFKDINQIIWFIGYKSGITVLTNDTLKSFQYNNILRTKGLFNSVCVDFKIDNKTIYYSSLGKGISIINNQGQHSILDMNQHVHQLFYKIQNDNNIFAITDNNKIGEIKKIKIINSDFNTISSYPISKNLNGRAHANIDSNNFLFQANLFELILFDGNSYKKVLTSPGRIINISIYNGNIFLATTKGFCKFPLNEIQNLDKIKYYLENKVISAVSFDLEGGLWISTIGSGLYYFIENEIINLSNKQLRTDIITEIHFKHPYLYTGSYNGKINRIDSLGQSTIYEIIDKSISSINNLGDTIFIATHSEKIHSIEKNKLKTFDANSIIEDGSIDNNSLSLKTIMKIDDNSLIFSSNNDLLKLSNNKLRLFQLGDITLSKAQYLYQTFNYFILYSDIGLNVINKNNFQLEEIPFELKSLKLKLLKLVNDSSIIIISENNNFFLWNIFEESVYQIDICNDCIIKDLFIDTFCNIWLATNEGVKLIENYFNSKQLNSLEFDIKDGIQSNNINKILIDGNYIFTISETGVDIINKEKLLSKKSSPKNIFLGYKTIGSKSSLNLKSDMPIGYNNLKFFFTASSLSSHGDIEYKYRLVGKNRSKDWVLTPNRTAEFNNVSAGDYCFEFTSKNKNGYWNKNLELFHFNIPITFNKSWYFKLMSSMILLILIYTFFKSRLSEIRREKEYHQQLITDKNIHHLTALRAQMNPHFMFNSLNSIQAYVTDRESSIASDYLGKFSKLMREVLETSKKPSIPLAREIDILTEYLDLEKDRFKNAFDYLIELSPEVNSYDVTLPPLLLQPFIENSILHGFKNLNRKGLIKIGFSVDDYVATCIIEDNGIGRKAAKKDEDTGIKRMSLGMYITHNRVDLINEIEDINLTTEIIDLKGNDGIAQGTRVIIKFNIYNPKKFEL